MRKTESNSSYGQWNSQMDDKKPNTGNIQSMKGPKRWIPLAL
jgi:hypothetical protein